MKKILVISNDEIYSDKNVISAKFNDILNILQALSKNFRVFLISKKTSNKKYHKLVLKNFVQQVTFKFINKYYDKENLKILIVSVTPRNFIIFCLLNFIIKDLSGYVYLRSNGHKEYYSKLNIFGYFFYDLMLKKICKKLKVISVSEKIQSYRMDYLVKPSELNEKWFKNRSYPNLDKVNLLYLGRFKKEKGVFSLIKLISKIKIDYRLTLAGENKNIFINNLNVNFMGQISEVEQLINLYDQHNIFILPSFTEGSPKVVLESLARKRPVIIFPDIKHVKSNYRGVFECKRDSQSLENIIKYILKNYKKIQNEMKNNLLYQKEDFQNDLVKIVNG